MQTDQDRTCPFPSPSSGEWNTTKYPLTHEPGYDAEKSIGVIKLAVEKANWGNTRPSSLCE